MKNSDITILHFSFFKKLLFLLCVFLMMTCESVDFTDCIIKKRTELPDKQLIRGHVGEYYYDEIKASINNEPNDNDYKYTFNVKGRLPEGFEVWDDGRFLVIEGVTLQKGNFTIQVSVSAVAYETDDESDISLCGIDSTSRGYTIEIGD